MSEDLDARSGSKSTETGGETLALNCRAPVTKPAPDAFGEGTATMLRRGRIPHTPLTPTRMTFFRQRFHGLPTRCAGQIALILLLLASAGSSALCQRPISLGVAGGVSAPVGTLGSDVVPGLHAMAILDAQAPGWPVGVELDADFTSFYFERALVGGGSSGSLRVLSASLNLTHNLSGNARRGAYLLAGAGAYRTTCTDNQPCGASTRAGWDLGLGANHSLHGQNVFFETRYRRSSRERGTMSYFPISLGLRF